MSEMFCIHCGKQISDQAKFCPECGKPTPYNTARSVYPMGSEDTGKQSEPIENDSGRTVNEIIADYHDRRLSQRAKLLFSAHYVGRTGLMPAIFIVGIYFYPILFILLLIIYIIAIYVTAELTFNNFRYCLTETGFEKEHGIIHKHSVTVPYVQIQNVNVERNLIDRMLGLARISIETAGSTVVEPKEVVGGNSTHSEAHLPGISVTDAKSLHDSLFELAHKRHLA